MFLDEERGRQGERWRRFQVRSKAENKKGFIQHFKCFFTLTVLNNLNLGIKKPHFLSTKAHLGNVTYRSKEVGSSTAGV